MINVTKIYKIKKKENYCQTKQNKNRQTKESTTLENDNDDTFFSFAFH